jgi:signal transduction histidine kinase
MSLIEAGRMVLERSKAPLRDLAAEAVGVLRNQAESKQIDLSLMTAEDAGFVFCDPQKIERVLINVMRLPVS